MKKMPWLEPLNIAENQLNNWLLEKPTNYSTTFWCLNKSYISEEHYIDWAKSHYQIPAMGNNYKDFKIEADFWQQIKDVSNWSDQLVPLYFYENTLFVLACEPLDMSWSFPVNFVLGTPKQLSFFWNILTSENNNIVSPELINPPAQSSAPNSKTVEVKDQELTNDLPADMPKLNLDKPIKQKETPSAKSKEPSTENVFTLKLNSTNNSSQGKVGFEELETQFNISSNDINADINDPSNLFDGFDNLNENTDTPNHSLEGLDGLNLNENKDNNNIFDGIDLSSPTGPSEKLDLSISDSAPSEMPPLSTTTKNLRLTKVNEANHLDLNLAIDQRNSIDNLSTKNVDKAILTEFTNNQSFKTIAPNVEANNIDLAQENIGNQALKINRPLNNFDAINKLFKQSLIFKLTNNHIEVSHQDGSWDLSASKNIELTKEPSLFNFCLISKLPFHGPVSSADALKIELFSSLNITNKNEHITLMPIINNSHNIEHFILATSDEQNLANLNELEKTVPNILKELTA